MGVPAPHHKEGAAPSPDVASGQTVPVHEGGDHRWSKILMGTDMSASADRAIQAAAEPATKTASIRRRTSRRSIPRHRTAISSSSPKGLILGDVSRIFDEPLLERRDRLR
jgi:hypothetical protein